MSDMIYRIDGGTTVVKASAIKDVDDLAYAMGFLANHFLYKMSKAEGEVSAQNVLTVAEAFDAAAERFEMEIVNRITPRKMPDTISDLGIGRIENPYQFV